MRAFVYLTLTLAVAATGCSEKRMNVSGTITRDGKPLPWPNDEGHLLVIFVPENRTPEDNPVRAETDRSAGTYRITGIKPGRYLVAVHMFDDHHMDALSNKYDPAHSPLRYEVVTDGQVINVDLPKDLPK